jgi:pimeloyl-ACP methyl ester carboxylesterase
MPKAKANDIEIEYETFGDPSLKPLLLIMGLGSQLISWEVELCKNFVEHGFYVIRFDNRDVGLSTKLEELGTPNVAKMYVAAQKGEKVNAPYLLKDMADDVIGLKKAHICGASMGGMIAQTIALHYPSRVLSLTSIMSSTGNPNLPRPKPEALKILLTPRPTERQAYIEDSVKVWRFLYGPGFPFDENKRRRMAEIAYVRSFYPPGMARQLAAIIASGNRKALLKSVNLPTLVIHGKDDPLVPVEAGKDTAESIPNAELLLIEGMGHSLPPEIWDQIVLAITKNAAKTN